MRIIKAAKKTDEFITTCNNCGSILGIKRNDLSNNAMIDDNKCDEWTYYCGVCKCCNHLNGSLHKLFPWIMEDENDRQLQSDHPMRVNTL